MIADSPHSVPTDWTLERRADNVVVVRIHSRRDVAAPLPDAVFTFRVGDPQYDYWRQQVDRREAG